MLWIPCPIFSIQSPCVVHFSPASKSCRSSAPLPHYVNSLSTWVRRRTAAMHAMIGWWILWLNPCLDFYIIHLHSPETVANNEKKKKIHKTDYLQNIQFRHRTQRRLRIKLSFRCASCSLGILKLNINWHSETIFISLVQIPTALLHSSLWSPIRRILSSVCPSVRNAVHCGSQGQCIGLKVVPASVSILRSREMYRTITSKYGVAYPLYISQKCA